MFLKEKPLPYERGANFTSEHSNIFSIFFCLVMFHESQTGDPMVVEKCVLYILVTLILFNLLHLTIGSK